METLNHIKLKNHNLLQLLQVFQKQKEKKISKTGYNQENPKEDKMCCGPRWNSKTKKCTPKKVK